MNLVIKKISHFLFPPICPHCQSFLENEEKIFCKTCLLFFEPLNPITRCFYCFTENEKRLCDSCRKKRGRIIPLGSVWERFGPVSTFMQKLKREELISYIKLATSFLILQFSKLSFPDPDYIVPVPSFWLESVWKGESLNYILGKNLGKYLQVPLMYCLYRNFLNRYEYKIKKRAQIEGKKILVFNTEFSEKKEWETLSEILFAQEPEKVYALTLSYSALN